MDNRVTIVYRVDIEAGPEQPAHLTGETFTVTDAATARAVHPLAEVTRYADGRAFVAADDPSLHPPKPEKPAKPAKPDTTQ